MPCAARIKIIKHPATSPVCSTRCQVILATDILGLFVLNCLQFRAVGNTMAETTTVWAPDFTCKSKQYHHFKQTLQRYYLKESLIKSQTNICRSILHHTAPEVNHIYHLTNPQTHRNPLDELHVLQQNAALPAKHFGWNHHDTVGACAPTCLATYCCHGKLLQKFSRLSSNFQFCSVLCFKRATDPYSLAIRLKDLSRYVKIRFKLCVRACCKRRNSNSCLPPMFKYCSFSDTRLARNGGTFCLASISRCFKSSRMDSSEKLPNKLWTQYAEKKNETYRKCQ